MFQLSRLIRSQQRYSVHEKRPDENENINTGLFERLRTVAQRNSFVLPRYFVEDLKYGVRMDFTV
jgi:hypothetical protein